MLRNPEGRIGMSRGFMRGFLRGVPEQGVPELGSRGSYLSDVPRQYSRIGSWIMDWGEITGIEIWVDSWPEQEPLIPRGSGGLTRD